MVIKMTIPESKKLIEKQTIYNKIRDPLTDGELEHYLGKEAKNNIIKWSQLDEYNSIEGLLPHNQSYKIILIEQHHNVGHWVAIMRYNYYNKDVIEVFNSYGNNVLTELNYIKSIKNKLLGQSRRTLESLLDDAKSKKYDVIYNKRKFQQISPDINTCGRHIVLRLVCMIKLFYDLVDYIKFMDDSMKKWKESPDFIVSLLV